jgi:hypothetical protein
VHAPSVFDSWEQLQEQSVIYIPPSNGFISIWMQFLAGIAPNIFWIALGTRAAWHRSYGQRHQCVNRQLMQRRYLHQNLDHLRVRQPVKDMAAVPARFHQPGFAQAHQVLRDTGLPDAQHRFEVADAGILPCHRVQDLHPNRLPEQAQQVCQLVFWAGGYIRLHEYILQEFTSMGKE